MSDLAAALQVAIRVHAHQVDKQGKPYLLHVLRVVEAVSDEAKVVAEQWLDEHYPADVSLVCDRRSDDPGPRLAAALRDCLEASS